MSCLGQHCKPQLLKVLPNSLADRSAAELRQIFLTMIRIFWCKHERSIMKEKPEGDGTGLGGMLGALSIRLPCDVPFANASRLGRKRAKSHSFSLFLSLPKLVNLTSQPHHTTPPIQSLFLPYHDSIHLKLANIRLWRFLEYGSLC